MADEQTPPEPTEPTDETPPEGEASEQQEPEEGAAPVVPEDLTAVEEESLRELHTQLSEYRAAARERQDIEAVRFAFDAQERIATEIQRRRDDETRVLEELTQLDQQVSTPLPDPAPALAGAGANAAQVAAVRQRVTPQSSAAQVPPPPAPARPRAALVAAAGNDTAPAGTTIDLARLGAAIERHKNTTTRVILASLPAFADDWSGLPEPLSDQNSTSRNDSLIREAQRDWRAANGLDEPLAAEARLSAICGPPEIIREIPDAFSTATPVADLFPSRPGGRGSFTYSRSGQLSDVTGAVTAWNETKQAAVDPTNATTWKPCATYNCPQFSTATLEAIVTCVQYDLTLDMSSPERVSNLNNAVGAVRARQHEGRLLQMIDALSNPFVFSGDYGALPVLVEAINSLMPQLSWWNRQEPGQYDMIVPPGLLEVLGIDRAARAYVDEDNSLTTLDYLRANLEGIRKITVALDASLGGEPGTFMDPLPGPGNQYAAGSVPFISGATYRVRLVAPEGAIYAETGEINAGVLRDANMIRQNKTGYFTEQFFTMAKNGPQPWATVDVQLCADGSRAGLVAPVGCRHS